MGRSGDHRPLHLQGDTETQWLSWLGHSQCKLQCWATLAWTYFLQNPRSWRAELGQQQIPPRPTRDRDPSCHSWEFHRYCGLPAPCSGIQQSSKIDHPRLWEARGSLREVLRDSWRFCRALGGSGRHLWYTSKLKDSSMGVLCASAVLPV